MKSINPNLIVAPPFPHGEIVNGFLYRTQRYSGIGSLSLACQRLLQRRPGLDGIPNGLDAFHREVGHLYGTLEMIIYGHTEINFHQCGQPRPQFGELRARMSGIKPGPVRPCRLPLLMGVGEGAHLQCPECAAEYEKVLGFSFVSRLTCAPFVQICPRHAIPFRSSWGQGLLYDAKCQGKPDAHQLQMAIELAMRIEYCLETPAELSKYHKDNVIKTLKLCGWIGDNGRLFLAQLKGAFAVFYAGGFSDERLSLLCQAEKYIENALRALLRHDHAVHPIWCILFTWFAEENYRSATPWPTASSATRRSHSKDIPSRQEVEAALKEHCTLKATAQALNTNGGRLTWICKRYGIKLSWRPKNIDYALEAEIKKAYQAGMVPKQAMKKFRVKQSTAYRLFAQCTDVTPLRQQQIAAHTDECKKEWLRAIKENPGKTATQLRLMHPAIWACLHRNATPWLKANSPVTANRGPRTAPTPPQALRNNLDLALAEAAANFAAEDSKPIRKSSYQLRAATGISEYALRNHEKTGAVERHKESRNEFIRRRVTKAFPDGVTTYFKAWDIARKAGLREDTVRKFLMR